MRDKKMTLEIAKWEFGRWFKLKEQVITLIVSVAISALVFGGVRLFDKFGKTQKTVAIISDTPVTIPSTKESGIVFNLMPVAAKDSMIALCKKETIDGVLILQANNQAELVVRKKGKWVDEIQAALTVLSRQERMAKAGISPEIMQSIFAEAKLRISSTEETGFKSTEADKIAAGIFIGFMLIGVFLGLAYQFVAITGEKQLRITEVIVSAVSPQIWIDGKIIGISLLSVALLLTYILSSILFVGISAMLGSGWSFPVVAGSPALMMLLLLFAMLGFMFWNTFFAAIAATINDPNTSARGSLIMLPSIPIAIAFLAFSNPDSLTMRVLSIFPLTAAPVMSVRLVLTSVSWLEILTSALLLIFSVHLLRNMAGKIFALSILMYGKEPSFGEMMKWLKKENE